MKNYEFVNRIKNCSFVDEILLFGSRAREEHPERADIDLAIKCLSATDSDWETVLSIVDDADTLLDIDCVRFEQIKNEKFRDAILENHKVLFKRDTSDG